MKFLNETDLLRHVLAPIGDSSGGGATGVLFLELFLFLGRVVEFSLFRSSCESMSSSFGVKGYQVLHAVLKILRLGHKLDFEWEWFSSKCKVCVI